MKFCTKCPKDNDKFKAHHPLNTSSTRRGMKNNAKIAGLVIIKKKNALNSFGDIFL